MGGIEKNDFHLLGIPISWSGLIHGLIPKPCSSGQEPLSKAVPHSFPPSQPCDGLSVTREAPQGDYMGSNFLIVSKKKKKTSLVCYLAFTILQCRVLAKSVCFPV